MASFAEKYEATFEERFWARVAIGEPDECWEWQGWRSPGPGGYGGLKRNGKRLMAHRVAYEFGAGPIPEGMQIDHLCRNRPCVNPDHLEVVTPLENTRRSNAPSMVLQRGGCCRNGHPFHEDDVREYRGRSLCKPCTRAYLAGHRAGVRKAQRDRTGRVAS